MKPYLEDVSWHDADLCVDPLSVISTPNKYHSHDDTASQNYERSLESLDYIKNECVVGFVTGARSSSIVIRLKMHGKRDVPFFSELTFNSHCAELLCLATTEGQLITLDWRKIYEISKFPLWRYSGGHYEPVQGECAIAWALRRKLLLRDIHISVQLEDTSEIRGQIDAVKHSCRNASDTHWRHHLAEFAPGVAFPTTGKVFNKNFNPPTASRTIDPIYHFKNISEYKILHSICIEYERLACENKYQRTVVGASGVWMVKFSNPTTVVAEHVHGENPVSHDVTYTLIFEQDDDEFGRFALRYVSSQDVSHTFSAKRLGNHEESPAIGREYHARLNPVASTNGWSQEAAVLESICEVVPRHQSNPTTRKERLLYLPDLFTGIQQFGYPQDMRKIAYPRESDPLQSAWIKKSADNLAAFEAELLSSSNSAQRSSIQLVHKPTNNVVITIGPPGTGKTHTLVKGIYNLALNGHKIMLCGASNAQLNELCLRLHEFRAKSMIEHAQLPHPEIVRVFPTSREIKEQDDLTKFLSNLDLGVIIDFETIPPDLTSILATHLAKTVSRLLRSSNKSVVAATSRWTKGTALSSYEIRLLDEAWIQAERMVIDDAAIVISTCVASQSIKLDMFQAIVLAIDEAAAIPELTALIPVSRYRRKLQLVWLLGDPAQLPPRVQKDLPTCSIREISLLLRLFALGFRSIVLNKQYRMRPELLEFPNQQFYNGQLQSGYESTEFTQQFDDFCKDRGWPIDLVALASSKAEAIKTTDLSWVNDNHADLVVRLLCSLNGSPQRALLKHTAVLTFYKAQAILIFQKLQNAAVSMPALAEVFVGTVDGYQGRESKVVILELTRTARGSSTSTGKLLNPGFVGDPRRLNVALTRGQDGLILIADRMYCSRLDKKKAITTLWNRLLPGLEEGSDEGGRIRPGHADKHFQPLVDREVSYGSGRGKRKRIERDS